MARNPDAAPEICPEEVWKGADQIEGWLTREEADLLWRYAAAPWCEVGTYRGRSAAVLAARGPGYCIDRFEEWYDAMLPPNVTILRGDFHKRSGDVPCVGLLYIDADHSYEATHEAWRLYSPKVTVGGHVAIHDALELHRGQLDWPEVNDFVHDQMVASTDWRLVAAAHRTVVFRREA